MLSLTQLLEGIYKEADEVLFISSYFVPVFLSVTFYLLRFPCLSLSRITSRCSLHRMHVEIFINHTFLPYRITPKVILNFNYCNRRQKIDTRLKCPKKDRKYSHLRQFWAYHQQTFHIFLVICS